MVIAIVKQKKESKKLQKIQNIPPEIREGVLKRYLNKCKLKHAYAFFEWRRKRHLVKVKVLFQFVTIA